MFELLKKEMGFTEVAARIQFTNGRTAYGVLLDCLPGEPISGEVSFVRNEVLASYHSTEHPRYVQVLSHEMVEDIDTCLK